MRIPGGGQGSVPPPGKSQVVIGVLKKSGTDLLREADCISRDVRTPLIEIR